MSEHQMPLPHRPENNGSAFRQWMGIVALFAISGGLIGGALQNHIDNESVIARLGSIEKAVKNIKMAGGGGAAAGGDEDEASVTPEQVASVVRPSDAMFGDKNAKVLIVEFSDFQCPFCRRFYEDAFKQIGNEYGNKVKFVFKHLPLKRIHPDAELASIASECANLQGKFWEYHNAIFEDNKSLKRDDLIRFAERSGVGDMNAFSSCVDNRQTQGKVDKDLEDAAKLDVRGTPAFFVNGKRLSGAQPFPMFKEAIDEALKG